MASSPKEKFDAAVKVIRGLPKNGSFQPSHQLMLKFYSYFKQATEGPCSQPKPGFWDLVNRKKWEAWSNLGDMDPEEAMLLYVDELKQIVETMPQTEAVTEFLTKLENFYEMVEDSENHNTLKILDKPKPNGSIPMNDARKNGLDKENLDHSDNITQLLKQDMNMWQNRPAILNGNNANTANGTSSQHSSDHEQNGPTNGDHRSGEEEENEYDDDEDDDEIEDEKQGNGSTEEWVEVNEVKQVLSYSESADDTETENEEFCDTSDEPIELPAGTSMHSTVNRLPPLTESSTSSTPLGGGKYVHFEPKTSDPQLSDSLVVNASLNSRSSSELLSQSHPGEITLLDTTPDASQIDNLDISMCRGGEEQERERRRRGGGQGSREWSTSGARGGHGGSGGDGTDSGSGGGGRRGLFPGPGGGGGGGRGGGPGGAPTDLNEQIVVTLLRLQHDMSGVLNRLNSLEALVKEGRMEKERKSKAAKSWWPFPDLSMKSALVIFVWPLIVHFVIMYINRRRRKLGR